MGDAGNERDAAMSEILHRYHVGVRKPYTIRSLAPRLHRVIPNWKYDIALVGWKQARPLFKCGYSLDQSIDFATLPSRLHLCKICFGEGWAEIRPNDRVEIYYEEQLKLNV